MWRVITLALCWFLWFFVCASLSGSSSEAMRLVMQRVKKASVTVDDRTVGEIGRGLLVLVGIEEKDTEADASWCMDRILKTQFWPENPGAPRDEEGRPWKHSVSSKCFDVLCVSQFTLYGTLKKKKKGQLDFHHAMGGEAARGPPAAPPRRPRSM